MYSREMMDSMKRLEETRAQRRGEKLPLLSPEEKKALLSQFHPDYSPDSTREMKVGANASDMIYHEYADLLEARSPLDPDEFSLSDFDYDVDVLIIGAGGAGCAAALTAFEAGARVLIATKLRMGDANTMMAQGGIQAADKPNATPPKHYIDVVGGGPL